MGRLHLLIDCALIGLAALVAFSLREQTLFAAFSRPGVGLYLLSSILLSLIVLSSMRVSRGLWRFFSFVDVFKIGAATGLVVVLTWFLTFLIDRSDLIPRSVPILHWILATGALCAARTAVRMLFQPESASKRDLHVDAVQHVLVVGSNECADLYIRCAKQLSHGTVDVIGLLTEDGGARGRDVSGVTVLGCPTDIASLVQTQTVHGVFIDRVVVAQPFDSLSPAAQKALRDYERVNDRPLDFFEERLGFKKPDPKTTSAPAIASAETVATRGVYPLVKRAADAVGAFALLVLCAPLIVMVWIAVLIDVGSPAYFWQLRPGLRGKPLRVLKFRTMRGAHNDKGERLADEERLSAVGDALRRYRMDELPQLINVLKGDMSFIGPRPLLPVDQPKDAGIRLSVRPGLTGWAQVNGGRLVSPEDKAALDAWYVENMSFALDVRIALMTIRVVLFGEKGPAAGILNSAHGSATRQRLRPR